MDNKNEEKMTFTTRTERREIEEKLKKKQKETEAELENKRKELKKILFDDQDEKKETKDKKSEMKKEDKNIKDTGSKKPIITNVWLSITIVAATVFLIFSIVSSVSEVNQLYQVINGILIFVLALTLSIGFKRTFFKNKTTAIAANSFVLILLIAFNGLYMAGILKLPTQSYIPSFSNKPLTEAMSWALDNNIEFDQTFEYSDDIDKYNVIYQSVDPYTLTKDISTLDLVISNGPDYEKEVIVPDMTGLDVEEVMTFIEENKLNNVSFKFEENTSVERNIVISQSSSGTMKRNESIIFTVSIGNKADLSPISLKDLKDETLLRASLYLGQNGVLYELKYEFSDEVAKDHVISSSPKAGTTVNPDDLVTLTISKGKKITVPELENMSLEEVTKWIIQNNLTIEYSEEYNDEIEKGRVIIANYNKGDVIEEGTIVSIIVSKGTLTLPSFTNINDFKSWAATNQVKYEIQEKFSDEIAKDNIIKFSINVGDKIKAEETITVYVSRGKAVTVPDFVNHTRDDIQSECDKLGLVCTFSEQYSNNVTENRAISQSVKAGEQVAEGDSINIVIATNSRTSSGSNNSSTSGNSGNSGSSGSSNNSSGSNNNPTSPSNPETPTTPDPAPTCEYYEFTAGGTGSNGNQTCAIMKNTKFNGKLNIKCDFVTECPNGQTANGAVCSYSHTPGSSVSTCDEITIVIVNRE